MAVQQQRHAGPGGGELSQPSQGRCSPASSSSRHCWPRSHSLSNPRPDEGVVLARRASELVVPTDTLAIFEGRGLDAYRVLILVGTAGLGACRRLRDYPPVATNCAWTA